MSGRRSVHELDPELRDRLLALDEPIARPDWQDVVSRSGTDRPRRIAVRAMSAAVAVCAAAIAVAPALGIRLGPINFWAAPSAPPSARSAFTQAKAWLGDSLRGLNVAETRRISVEVFRGDTEHLFVAPRTGGGFCYVWATEPGDPGIWAEELGGCADRSRPLSLGYDDTRISIVADRGRVGRVVVKLSDGRTVQPSLRWVSAPINAGFILYQPPSHTHVLEVEALARNRVVEMVQIDQQIFNVPLR